MNASNRGSVATVRHPYGAYIRQGSTQLGRLFAVKPAVDGTTTSRHWGRTQYTSICVYIYIYIYIYNDINMDMAP